MYESQGSILGPILCYINCSSQATHLWKETAEQGWRPYIVNGKQFFLGLSGVSLEVLQSSHIAYSVLTKAPEGLYLTSSHLCVNIA